MRWAPPNLSSFRKILSKTSKMNREELYPLVLKLHEKGLGNRRIHNLIPQIPSSTIGYWIYRDTTPRHIPDLSPSAPLAFIVGVLRGDGYAGGHDYAIELEVKDREFDIAFCEAMNKINLFPHSSRVGKYYKSRGGSKMLVEWYEKLDFNAIRALTESYPADFVRSFFDGEGTLRCNSETSFELSMCNTNQGTLQLIRELLSKLGFRTSIHPMKTPENRKQRYRLGLLGGTPDVIRLLKLVKPSIPRKTIEGSIAPSPERRAKRNKRSRERQHKRYATDSEYRTELLKRKRESCAKNRDEINQKRRESYANNPELRAKRHERYAKKKSI